LQDGAARCVARRFPDQRGCEDPRPLDTREIAVMRHAAHIADAPLRVAAAQSDEPREEAR